MHVDYSDSREKEYAKDFRKGLLKGPIYTFAASFCVPTLLRKIDEYRERPPPIEAEKMKPGELKGFLYSSAATLLLEIGSYGYTLAHSLKYADKDPLTASLILLSPLMIQIPDALYEMGRYVYRKVMEKDEFEKFTIDDIREISEVKRSEMMDNLKRLEKGTLR